MDDNTTDIIVVGGGVMGCAAAYQLATDGQRVRVLEQYTIGNRQGSSHGASRLFRLAHTTPDYVELARGALLLWRELESESGERLMQQVDALDIGSPKALEEMLATLQTKGVSFDAMDRDQIMDRFPHFSLPEDTLGLYQTDYALLRAESCVNAFAKLARQHGAMFAERQTVQHIHPSGGSVQIVTDKARYNAGCVILCAGSWMRPLVRQLDLDLPLIVRKELITYYKPSDPAAWMPGRFPIFRHHHPGYGARWGVGFPIFEHTGTKMLLDCTGPVIQPGDRDRSVDQDVLGRVRAYIASILPSLGNDIIETGTCLYTMTPDDDFILDHHPSYPQILIASPCSGHGFKFAPLIGRILADLALHCVTDYNIDRFRLDRPTLRKSTG